MGNPVHARSHCAARVVHWCSMASGLNGKSTFRW
jgi:hypothetical protein